MTENKEEISPVQEGIVNLKILLKEDVIFELPISTKENLYELRTIVSDMPKLYFAANFHFEHEGKIVNEYLELDEAIENLPEKEVKIQIVFDDYDLRSLKDLIEKANTFFKNPKGVAATLNYNQNTTMQKLDFFNLADAKKRKSKKSKTKLTLDKIMNPELNILTHISSDQSIKPSIDKANNYVKLLEYSSWNPPPRRRKMIGDFFYLRVVTLEGEEFHVTAFSKGFYIQKSTVDIFDPTAESIPYFSLIDLLSSKSAIFKAKVDQGLFKSLNLSLKNIELTDCQNPQSWLTLDEEIEQHQADNFSCGKDIFNNHGYSMNVYRDWSEELHACRQIPETEFYSKLNKKKTQNKITQEFLSAATDGAKAIIDGDLRPFNFNMPEAEQCFVYNNIFFTYAIDNYMDLNQKRSSTAPSTLSLANTDLRNMSILQNSSITPITGTKKTDSEENEYTKAEAEAPSLRTINTAIIFYKGHSMIAQSMIQGILYFDHATWGKYGSIDDGQTINFDEGFDKQMKVISRLFNVREGLKFKDGQGKEWTLNSSIEVKGIQGGDGRKYILDFLRTSPRDLNWGTLKSDSQEEPAEGEDNQEVKASDYNCCVFRLGMLKNFILTKKMQVMTDIRNNHTEEIEANKAILVNFQKEVNLLKIKKEKEIRELKAKGEDVSNMEGIKFTEEQENSLKKYNETNKELTLKIDQEINEKLKELDLDNLRFNQCLATPLPSYVDDEKTIKEDGELLKELADFVQTKMLNRVYLDLQNLQRLSPIDNASLGSFLHRFHINIRYLGALTQKFNPEKHPSIHLLFRKSILVRCLKHYINEALREIPVIQLSQTITHILNCVLGSKLCSEHISGKVAQLRIGIKKKSEEEELIQSGKKKRKKAKKMNKMKIRQVDCGLVPNRYMLQNTADLMEEINKIASYKYKYTFEEKEFYQLKMCSSSSNLLSLLRDICKSVGLVLRIREFIFRDNSMTRQSIQLPIRDTDIIDFTARTKYTNFEFADSKIQLDAANKLLKNKEFERAKELFEHILQINMSVYGPFNVNTIESAKNIANFYMVIDKLEDAIAIQKTIVDVCEKTFGIDNINTINAFADLAKYYFKCEMKEKAIESILKALYLSDLVGGEFCINSLGLLDELKLVYLNNLSIDEAIQCSHEKTQRLSRLYNEGNWFLINHYKQMGRFYFQIAQFTRALELTELRLAQLEKYHKEGNEKEILLTKREIESIKAQISSGKQLSSEDVAMQFRANAKKVQEMRSQQLVKNAKK